MVILGISLSPDPIRPRQEKRGPRPGIVKGDHEGAESGSLSRSCARLRLRRREAGRLHMRRIPADLLDARPDPLILESTMSAAMQARNVG